MILITGASGYIGKHLVIELLKTQQSIAITLRKTSDIGFFTKLNVKIHVVKSIDSETNWEEILPGVKIIYHFAGVSDVKNVRKGDDIFKINVEGTKNLAVQAIRAKVERFIFLSTVKIFGEASIPGTPFNEKSKPNPLNDYALSKLKAELVLKTLNQDCGLGITIINPPAVYGEDLRGNIFKLIRLVSYGLPLPLGGLKSKKSFIGINNLIDFLILIPSIATTKGEQYLISDGQDLPIKNILAIVAKAQDKKLRLFFFPVQLIILFFMFIGRKSEISKLVNNLEIDISKVKSTLNWMPLNNLEEGLFRFSKKINDKN